MSRYLLFIGGGLVFAAGCTKLAVRVIRQSKLSKATASFDSPSVQRHICAFRQPMNRTEAALILGVKSSATEQQVLAAHKRLMFLNHPDFGGSTLVSSKINEAKDILLVK